MPLPLPLPPCPPDDETLEPPMRGSINQVEARRGEAEARRSENHVNVLN